MIEPGDDPQAKMDLALGLMEEYHHGQRRALLDPSQRRRHHCAIVVLSPVDISIAELLLKSEGTRDSWSRLIHTVGPAQALRVLRLVLRSRHVEQAVERVLSIGFSLTKEDVTFVLEGLVLRADDFGVKSSMWRHQPSPEPYSLDMLDDHWEEMLDRSGEWWGGFTAVEDDVGTSFRRSTYSPQIQWPLRIDAQAVALQPERSTRVETGLVMGKRLTHWWEPSPPLNARRLSLSGPGDVHANSIVAEPPWLLPYYVDLGPLRFRIFLAGSEHSLP